MYIQHADSREPVDTRSTILFTGDDAAFPIAAAGRRQFSKDEVLGHLAEEVTRSVDGLLGQAPTANRRKRLWDLSVGHDNSACSWRNLKGPS